MKVCSTYLIETGLCMLRQRLEKWGGGGHEIYPVRFDGL